MMICAVCKKICAKRSTTVCQQYAVDSLNSNREDPSYWSNLIEQQLKLLLGTFCV